MNVGGLLGINDAINQVFTDIWQALVGLLTAVIGLVLNIGAVPISTTDPASPIAGLWPAMLTVGSAIAVILFFAQLAMAAFHPRRNLTHAVTGPVAYGVAIAATVTVVAVTLAAADGLTTLVLQQAAHVNDVGGAVAKLGVANTAMTGVKPVALALMGIVAILPLSIGFAVEMLFRAMAILVLVATIPLVAAGLTNTATRHWYWRAARWILAAIFIKPTLAITVAIGTLIVGNTHPGVNGAQALVTLLLGLGILFVSLFAPFALYRLFAFVEPGTMPHEAMRSAFNDARASFSQAAGAMGNPAANAPGLMSDAAARRWGGGNAADPAASAASSHPWPAVGFGGASAGASNTAGGKDGSATAGKAAAALAGVAAVAATGGAAAPALAAGSSAIAGTGAATGGAAAGGAVAGGAAAPAVGAGSGAGAGTGAAVGAASGAEAGAAADASGGAATASGSPSLGAAGSTGGPADAGGSGAAAGGGSSGGALPPGALSGSSPAGVAGGGASGGAGWSGTPGAADDPLWSSLPAPTATAGGGSGRGGGGGGRGHYGVGAITGGPSGLPGSVPGAGGGYDAPPPRPARDDAGTPAPARGPLPGRAASPRHLDDVVDPVPDPPEDSADDYDGGPEDGDDRGWRRGEGHGLSGVL